MAQIARPDSDVTVGAWLDDGGGTPLFEAINEIVAVDSDFIRSEDDPSTSSCEVGLENLVDPVSSAGHTFRYRYRKGQSGGGQPGNIRFTVYLFQGTTEIDFANHLDIGTAFVDGSFTLPAAEADSITDYTDLRARFEANKFSGVRTSWAEVSWYELEVPDPISRKPVVVGRAVQRSSIF